VAKTWPKKYPLPRSKITSLGTDGLSTRPTTVEGKEEGNQLPWKGVSGLGQSTKSQLDKCETSPRGSPIRSKGPGGRKTNHRPIAGSEAKKYITYKGIDPPKVIKARYSGHKAKAQRFKGAVAPKGDGLRQK